MNAQLIDEIERACVRLSNAFSYHCDHRNYPEVAALFAPDGAWLMLGTRLEGRAAILAALEKRSPEQFSRHITAGHYFTHVSTDKAMSVSYTMSYYSMDGSLLPMRYVPEQAMLTDFIDTYRLTDEGWRFAERNTSPVMMPEELREIMTTVHR